MALDACHDVQKIGFCFLFLIHLVVFPVTFPVYRCSFDYTQILSQKSKILFSKDPSACPMPSLMY